MSTVAAPLEVSSRLVDRVAASTYAFPAVMGVAVVHMVDDAIVNRPAGTSIAFNLATIAVPVAVAVAASVGAPFLRPGLRAWLAIVLGSVLVVDGGLHLAHVRKAAGVSADDLTGLLSGAAGLYLVAVGVALAFRRKAARSPLRRWSIRLACALGLIATIVFVIMPLAVGIYFVHKQPVEVASSTLALPHEDVTFRSSDGIKLGAWYVPPKNGAVVITIPGSGGDRAGGIESRTLMLARHGFGVLSYDPRGTGNSEGRPEAVGWTWYRDVRGAVDYLHRRGVTKIGLLGLSTGAEVSIDSAARDDRIGAIVAESAEARTFTEITELPFNLSNLITGLYTSEMFTVHHVLSHAASPPALKTQVAKIGPRPVFLISTGKGYEQELNDVYYRAARDPKTLWNIPDAGHTGGLSTKGKLYERRVVAFLRQSLVD
jgi:pimeloyl-ACP methyl ester carboxylesterase